MPLYSGALHYFRLARGHWRDALQAIKDLGLPMVETYVPWAAHETAPGSFDFGTARPELDLGGFLDLSHALGLKVFLRPGPHINGELTRFGLPSRVVHDPRCQARSPLGRPVYNGFPPQMFPVPSFASEVFRGETAQWYRAVAEVVRPRVWPDGPVVLIQVDNEGALYFRNGPFDQDYRPEALAVYHRELERVYGDPATLGEGYDTTVERFSDVSPPTHFDATTLEALPRQLDWQSAHERLVQEGLAALVDSLRDAGLGRLPPVHNLPLAELAMPLPVPALARTLDIVGLDYYHRGAEFETIKRRTLYAAGTLPFAYAPEIGVGGPPWFTSLSADDSLFCAMTATAFGLRGFNLYMAVDRDRWYGSPIDARGHARPRAEAWRKLLGALTALEVPRLTRDAKVGIVVPQIYRRLARATHLLGGMVSPAALEIAQARPVDGCRDECFGLSGPPQILFWEALGHFSAALTRAQIPYVLIDSDAEEGRFACLNIIFTPSYEFMDNGLWHRLQASARQGATIYFGPHVPARDSRMRPADFETVGRMIQVDPEDAQALSTLIDHELGSYASPYQADTPAVEVTVHRAGHADRVLFVMNKSDEAVHATVTVPRPMRLRDALNQAYYDATERFALLLPPLSCRMLEIDAHRVPNGVPRDD